MADTKKPVASLKAEDKAVETKAAEVKAEAKKTEVKATAKKAADKTKATAKKAADKTKETAKKAEKKVAEAKTEVKATAKKATTTAKKTVAKKAEDKAVKAAATTVHVQFSGKTYTTEDLVKIAKDVWVYDLGNKVADFKSADIYVKPEESMAYYVINGNVAGSFAI